jgi:hypothetical protein
MVSGEWVNNFSTIKNLTIDFADVNTTADNIYLREGVSVTKPEDLPGT